MSAIGEVKNGDSQIASTPSDATCSSREVIPGRSPIPFVPLS